MQTIMDTASAKKTVLRSGDWQLHLTLFLLTLLPVVASALMRTDGVITGAYLFGVYHPLPIVCVFRLFTGYNCPTCGMTRCFIYMSHFQFSKALTVNFAGVAVYGLFLFEILYRGSLLIQGRIPGVKIFRIAEKCLIAVACALILVKFVQQFF